LFFSMTTTLEEIHREPAILDRAIQRRERLDIMACGEVTATLLPKTGLSMEEARRVMKMRFAEPDWEFHSDVSLNREERNARG